MPTYSVIEQIAQAIKAQLETVDGTPPYQHTVSKVTRPTRIDWDAAGSIDHLEVAIRQGPTVHDGETDDGNPPAAGFVATFSVYGFIKVSDSNTTPVDQLINDFAGDLQRALMDDVHWGGLAIDSEVVSVEPLLAVNGAFAGCEIEYSVRYRIQEDDPFTNRVG